MQYITSLSFRGDADRAFRLAESALTAIGFKLTGRTTTSREFVGPGMNSSRESALVGASRIYLRSDGKNLNLDADLDGVARMSRFVTLFPIALVLCLGIALTAVFSGLFGPGSWIGAVAAAVGANTVMWSLLGPLMGRWVRARTDQSLDVLLANMVSVGEAN